MNKLDRYLILFTFLFGALASYSKGHQTGLFVFIILGFMLEGAFWLGVFQKKRH